MRLAAGTPPGRQILSSTGAGSSDTSRMLLRHEPLVYSGVSKKKGSLLSTDPPIPTLVSFLTCDSVIRDSDTQKMTLVGLFDRVLSVAAPTPVTVGLYAKLRDGSGQYTFSIRMVSLADETLTLQVTSQPSHWTDPEAPMEFGINLRGTVVPAFGDYEFQLLANDIYLGRAVLSVRQLELPAQP